MRILHVDTERGWRGGQQQVLWLCLGLRARGHEQLVAVRRGGDLSRRLQAEGIAVAEIRMAGEWDPLARRALGRLGHEFAPHLVHTHSGHAHGLAVRAFAGRIPLVNTRRVDFPIRASMFSRGKYLARGQSYMAISRAVRDALVSGGVDASRISIVPSGIDTARVADRSRRDEWRARWGIGPGEFLFGCVGALVDHKDPLNLLDASRILAGDLSAPHRCIWVGEGDLRPAADAFIEANALAHVALAGWQGDMAGCLAAMDAFVMPSKLEGLGTALLDAMAAGLPCIGTRAGGIPDIITDGDNGLLVPPRDAWALADAMARIARDGALRERLATRGREVVNERFTADAMVEGTESVYREVAGA